jgi:hypothetical protein
MAKIRGIGKCIPISANRTFLWQDYPNQNLLVRSCEGWTGERGKSDHHLHELQTKEAAQFLSNFFSHFNF